MGNKVQKAHIKTGGYFAKMQATYFYSLLNIVYHT